MAAPSQSAELGVRFSVTNAVYNGKDSLAELCRRLGEVLPRFATQREIILVNDGSWEVISKLSSQSPMLRGLRLMRNYSQHNALLCDIRAAKYDVIVTMDDDLQHQAEEIPRLLAREGFELVYAAPESEQHGVWRAIAFRVTRFGAPFCWETYERISRFSRKITRGIRRLSVSVCFYRRASYLGNNALRCGNSCSRRAIRALQNIVLRKPARHALEMMTGFSTVPLQLPV